MPKDRFRVVEFGKKPRPEPSKNEMTGASAIGTAILILSPIILLAWCSISSPHNVLQTLPELMTTQEPVVRSRLRDPDSAIFTGEFVGKLQGKPVLCGSVNSKNGSGGMAGAQRFIAGGTTAGLETDFAPGEFEISWATACAGCGAD